MKKRFKSTIRQILERIVFFLQRKLGYTYWLHLGDVLTPCDGKITVGQTIVASRVLDIELIRAGLEPVWQNKLSEFIKGSMNTIEGETANNSFKDLVFSLDKRGFNPNVGHLSISDKPLVLNNGTHRVAYAILYCPNHYFPFKRIEKDLAPWFPLDSKSYWKNRGMIDSDIKILTDKYSQILNSVRTAITGYIRLAYAVKLSEMINDFGIIRAKQNVFFLNDHYCVFLLDLKKQEIFTDGPFLHSKYIEKLENKMTNTFGKEWGNIAHSVTESIELENKIESISVCRLKW